MKLTVKSIEGKDQGELDVRMPLLEDGRGSQALHDVVVAYQAAQRSGTACTKTMGEVAGTGKKPWRQKGTGRARAGSFASPLWRGGGVVFGPKPRDFRKKVGKQTRQLALQQALSARLQAGEIVVVDNLKLDSHKTRSFLQVLSGLDVKGRALIVVTKLDETLARASRNLRDVKLTTSETLNAYQLLSVSKVLFTREAFEQFQNRVAPAAA
jgi:large subunit ribosomal protein L4